MAIYVGTAGNDTQTGGSGIGEFETMYGLDGDDDLSSLQAGVILIEGGAGNDYISMVRRGPFGYGDNIPATGHLYGGNGNDLAFGYSKDDFIYGGDGDDVLVGSSFSRLPSGELYLYAFGGNDYLDGGNGVDAIRGSAGADIIYGGDGDDARTIITVGPESTDPRTYIAGLYGGAGNDYIDGGRGDDYLDGEAGVDILIGGIGNDSMRGGDDVDTLDGGLGDDTLSGQSGNDSIAGGMGNDNLDGGSEDDYIFGDAGTDLIRGGAGFDILFGGADSDVFLYYGIPGDGTDILMDFVAGSQADTLALHNALVSNFADVQTRLSYYAAGNATVLTIGNDQIFFANVLPSQLDASDFAFF
jgi:Ca2+-binding RTX toxin-like protein